MVKQLTEGQYKALRKLEGRVPLILDRLAEDGKISIHPKEHIGSIRGGDIARWLKRELVRVYGDGSSGIYTDAGQMNVVINFELDEKRKPQLKEYLDAFRSGRYVVKEYSTTRVPSVEETFEEQVDSIRIRLPQEKRFNYQTWDKETPIIVGINGLEKDLIKAYNNLNERERALSSITSNVDLIRTIGRIDSSEVLLKLDPEILKREEYDAKRRDEIVEEITGLDIWLEENKQMTLEEVILRSNQCKVPNCSNCAAVMSNPRYATRSYNKYINEEISKRQTKRKYLETEQNEIYKTDHRRNTRRKAEKIMNLKSTELDVPVFIFPENSLNAHVVVPKADGYVSHILSGSIDNLVPDDANMEATQRSLVYSLETGTDTSLIERGILDIADEIKDISGIRVFPKIVGNV